MNGMITWKVVHEYVNVKF